jgi:hypothetical protein
MDSRTRRNGSPIREIKGWIFTGEDRVSMGSSLAEPSATIKVESLRPGVAEWVRIAGDRGP